MAIEMDAPEHDPAKLAEAMANLKTAIVALRRQVKAAQGAASATRPVVEPKPEARAAIRQKAKTGALKPMRTPPAATGPVGPRATGRVKLTEPVLESKLEAVEGWESLSDLAKQNESKGRGR